MGERQKKKLLKHYTGRVKPTDLSRPFFEKTKGQDPVTRMQFTDLHLWLAGDILLKADKMSMANSLELRVPFLDKEVFEVARHIPVKYRANAGGTKLAMRGAAARSIPERTADKKKLGFPVPVRAWLRDEQYAAVVRKAFESEAAAKFFKTQELKKAAGRPCLRQAGQLAPDLVRVHVPCLVRRIFCKALSIRNS